MQTMQRYPRSELLAYRVMPNHWHLIVWPTGCLDSSASFMHWLTMTHAQRWHADTERRARSGLSRTLQSHSRPVRRAFPVACALRGTQSAPSGSGQKRGELALVAAHGDDAMTAMRSCSTWPIDRPPNWTALVNERQRNRNCLRALVESRVRHVDVPCGETTRASSC